MASNRRESDCEESDSDRELPQGQQSRPTRVDSDYDAESEQLRLFRQLNERLDTMQHNQVIQGDRMCDLVNKIDGGEELNFEWKKRGLKIQYQIATRVAKKVKLAGLAIKAKQFAQAQEYIEQGIAILDERIKHLRIADQSPHGWETVAHYERKAIAADDTDDKKLRKAEKDAQESSLLRSNNRRGRGAPRGRQNYPFHPYHSAARFPYRPIGPFRSLINGDRLRLFLTIGVVLLVLLIFASSAGSQVTGK